MSFAATFVDDGPWVISATSSAYTAQGVAFDGTDTMARAAALTGVVDGKKGILSFWLKMGGTDGANYRLFKCDSDHFLLDRLSANQIRVICQDSGGSNVVLVATSSATFAASSGWQHVIASWDVATAQVQLYVQDVSDASVSANNNVTIAYATGTANWNMAVDIGAGVPTFDVADFYFNTAESIDLSVAGNRHKFITAGLAPVDLGSDGSTPTGTAPAVYLHGIVSTWHTNDGTGGGFTLTGALAAAASNPP